MAEKYNMKLLFAKSFSTFFQEKSSEYNNLLSRMNALEVKIKAGCAYYNPFTPKIKKCILPNLQKRNV